jgi:hypothetical protein
MSLLQRATKLEALAESHVSKREWIAFRDWLNSLPREEAVAFLEFSLPTFVEMGIAPAYRVLPSQMSVSEKRDYAEAMHKRVEEHKARRGRQSLSEHRAIMDLWRRFVQRSSDGSRRQQVA